MKYLYFKWPQDLKRKYNAPAEFTFTDNTILSVVIGHTKKHLSVKITEICLICSLIIAYALKTQLISNIKKQNFIFIRYSCMRNDKSRLYMLKLTLKKVRTKRMLKWRHIVQINECSFYDSYILQHNFMDMGIFMTCFSHQALAILWRRWYVR